MAQRQPNPNLEPLAKVASRKDPSRSYTIYRHRRTGAISCNCGAWVFNPSCGACGERLEKLGGGEFSCPTHGRAGTGQATRACPHILAWRRGQARPATPPALQVALLAAADAASVRALLYERQWRDLARELASRMPAASAAPLENEIVSDGLRLIYLEDE